MTRFAILDTTSTTEEDDESSSPAMTTAAPGGDQDDNEQDDDDQQKQQPRVADEEAAADEDDASSSLNWQRFFSSSPLTPLQQPIINNNNDAAAGRNNHDNNNGAPVNCLQVLQGPRESSSSPLILATKDSGSPQKLPPAAKNDDAEKTIALDDDDDDDDATKAPSHQPKQRRVTFQLEDEKKAATVDQEDVKELLAFLDDFTFSSSPSESGDKSKNNCDTSSSCSTLAASNCRHREREIDQRREDPETAAANYRKLENSNSSSVAAGVAGFEANDPVLADRTNSGDDHPSNDTGARTTTKQRARGTPHPCRSRQGTTAPKATPQRNDGGGYVSIRRPIGKPLPEKFRRQRRAGTPFRKWTPASPSISAAASFDEGQQQQRQPRASFREEGPAERNPEITLQQPQVQRQQQESSPERGVDKASTTVAAATAVDGGGAPPPRDSIDALYQQAWEERESARQWAQRMRASVQNWADQQRALIQTERRAAIQETSSLLDRLQHSRLLQQQAQQSQEQEECAKRMVHALEDKIVLLQRNLKASVKQYECMENELHQIIRTQQERLDQLELYVVENNVPRGARMWDEYNTNQTKNTDEGHHGANTFGGQLRSITRSRGCGRQRADHMVGNLSTFPVDPQGGDNRDCSQRQPNGMADDTKNHSTINYGNGSKKECHSDGTVVIRFPNGDVQTQCPNQDISYYYAEEGVLQVTAVDGTVLLRFPSGQVERHSPDGTKTVTYPDGKTIRIDPGGDRAQTILPAADKSAEDDSADRNLLTLLDHENASLFDNTFL